MLMIALLLCSLHRAGSPGETEQAGEPRQITLQQALAAAERSPEIVGARARERAAAAGVRVAGAPADGSLSFSSFSISAGASLAASFVLPLERGSRMRAARAGVAVAERSTAESVGLARRELRAAWFALAGAEQRSLAVAERSERAERNLGAVDALFEQGRVSRLDHVRAAADAARLGLLMGLGADALLATAGRAPRPEAEPDLDGYLERVRRASPGLRAQQARLAGAEAALRLARRLRWPSLSLSAGANWSDPTQPGTDKWIGLGVAVPFGRGAGVAVASAEREGEEASVERERRLVLDAAQSAWRAARAARLRFEAVDGEALPAAREAAELTALAYREGRVDIFRVLDAERALADASLLHADALEAWGTAHAELLQLAGEEEP